MNLYQQDLFYLFYLYYLCSINLITTTFFSGNSH